MFRNISPAMMEHFFAGHPERPLRASQRLAAHSVRGHISGTLGKKMGLSVESTKEEGGERTYSLKS
jgi:hypothetical protein